MKQTRKAIQFFFIGTILLIISTISCSRTGGNVNSEPVGKSEPLLGTVCRITIYDNPSDIAFEKSFERIKEIEKKMSLHITSSEIAAINAQAGQRGVKVSEDTFYVIATAIKEAQLSGGSFDPTIGVIVTAWDIGGDQPRKPPQSELDTLLPLVGWEKVSLDESTFTVFLTERGMKLDLGAIAKGYAADEVALILREYGVNSAIINLGGNVLVLGIKPDHNKWRIGIQNPDSDRGDYFMIVNLDNQTLVTSGPYERFFEQDGVIYHHIIDTTTGYPVETDLSSVSIITEKSILADALSTAVYSLGLEKGSSLIESLEGFEAVFVDKNKNIYLTSGFDEKKLSYTLTDSSFTVHKGPR